MGDSLKKEEVSSDSMSQLMDHPDKETLDDRFVELFKELVAASVALEENEAFQDTSPAELERMADSCFEELEHMRSCGWRFNQRRYTRTMMKRITVAIEAGGEELTSLFFPYCEFMGMIDVYEGCDQLTKWFKERGWNEITSLHMNTHTFREIAEQFIMNAEKAFVDEPQTIDMSTAKTVNGVALLYNLFLSPELAGHITFIMCDSIEDYKENQWELPGNHPQLQ